MVRKIIQINADKCNGCSLCAEACHEGAIGMVDGKAILLRDDYCDGLGDCLPVCPTDAITFVEREALEYNEMEVEKKMADKKVEKLACGCSGTSSKMIKRKEVCSKTDDLSPPPMTQLNQWPVQIKLVPTNAPYLQGANLVIAADCAAYAYGNFHNEFMQNKITLIGCPKLDEGDYSEKLTAMLKQNDIKSVTVIRMEVPCCSGIENAVKTALRNCGKMIQWQVITISTEGTILN